MDAVIRFLHMGGYAQYVWPAYGIATVVLVGMVVESLSQYRRNRRDLARLEEARPARARRR
jgi:heme exporter protein D